MKTLYTLLAASLCLTAACHEKPKHDPKVVQWACQVETLADKRDIYKVKPEEAIYVLGDPDYNHVIKNSVKNKWDYKSSPSGWKVYHNCVKISMSAE